jgi:L-ascorbate metabolism protein UlaG (beta-lactamase superfamily)
MTMKLRRWMVAALLAAAVVGGGLIAFRDGHAEDAARDDVEQTNQGPLTIRPLVHGSVLLEFQGKAYYVDPAGSYAWDSLPKADLVLITHEHGDHLSPQVVDRIKKEGTQIIANERSAPRFTGAIVMHNGDRQELLGVTVEAVPAYNVVRTQYHPKGRDNGYVITFGDRRVYLAGDTEVTPELKALEKIDIAFLPISLPFTMSPEDAAEAAKAFKPRILYLYHQNTGDPEVVKTRLADVPGIEVRVRHLP